MNPDLEEILDTQFTLRGRLKNKKFHLSKSSIPLEEITEEKEPEIRQFLKQLASELCKNPNYILLENYTKTERAKDYAQLEEKEVLEDNEILPIDTRSRPGHKILDQYMSHIWDVKNHKGISVRSLFTQENLEKALFANLRNHSTPYRSEIRRMLIMYGSLGNVTKYKAITSKAIVKFFGAKLVLDPCIGWGGRMLGTIAAFPDSKYVGFEPDGNTYLALTKILKDEAIPEEARKRTFILQQPAEVGLSKLKPKELFDMVLTSPPYFNLEVYTSGEQSIQSYETWDDWVSKWLKPVIVRCLSLLKPDGVSCWSVKNFRTDKVYLLAEVTKKIHKEAGWDLIKTVKVTGSARMGSKRIEDGKEGRESEEETFCFRKVNTKG
jgi:hypothetical protein